VALILRPAALDLGLLPALEWLAEDFTLRSEIPCRVEASAGDVALGEKASIELFRIAQESLTNVARHARASQVRLLMRRRDDALEMSVIDDGCGFDPAQAQASGHFGLLGMRERALRLGGTLLIDSEPGRGATICVRLLPNQT
jgi:signal transduction histidine kinase